MLGSERLRSGIPSVGQYADIVRMPVIRTWSCAHLLGIISWSYLRYPIPKEKRIMLVDLYFNVSVTPGMPPHVVATCSDALDVLTRSKKKMSVKDIRLPWRPLYDILRRDLFLTRRQFEVRLVPIIHTCMTALKPSSCYFLSVKHRTMLHMSRRQYGGFSIQRALMICLKHSSP